MLALLGGKATADQLARRLGVHPETIVQWRDEAVEGMATSLRRGGRSERELELERENGQLRTALTESAIAQALLKQALDVERRGRPTVPARSRR